MISGNSRLCDTPGYTRLEEVARGSVRPECSLDKAFIMSRDL